MRSQLQLHVKKNFETFGLHKTNAAVYTSHKPLYKYIINAK